MPGGAVFLPPSMRSSYGPAARYQGGSPRLARAPLGSIPTVGFSRKTFENIENFIADNEASKEKVQQGIDLLVRAMVLAIKGFAQEKSGGPLAPRQRSVAALANRIPVQRITGRYYAGWTQRRLGHARWMVFNDAKEAWYVEYGIHQRVRRPVLKMSLIGMLGMLQTTRTGDRFMEWVLRPRRNSKGQFVPFGQRVGSGVLSEGHSYTETFGGSKSGKVASIHRNVLAGPKSRLP